MPKRPLGADLQLVPMLDYVARQGRRAAELAPDLLRPRLVIAMKLLRERGPVGQQGLSDALNLDPSNVVILLNELEERELITRRRDPADRRRHIVELSAQGDAALDEASIRFGELEDELFAVLTPKERRKLHGLLSRVVEASSSESAPPAP